MEGVRMNLIQRKMNGQKDLGCSRAYVGSYSVTAGVLYVLVVFTGYDLCYPWMKTF